MLFIYLSFILYLIKIFIIKIKAFNIYNIIKD